ncbi:MAG TPA: ABC transporter permease [Gemmatimonadaceae bacterium]|nr:ABC transporter permease [Gemmatimonadaceae bacterium]
MSGAAERWYARLLWLYPAEFRRRYARAMLDFHRDRVAAARQRGESMLLLWTSTVLDVIVTAAAERLRPLTTRSTREPVMQTMIQDIEYGLRGFRRRPAFAAIIIATIALGVGVNAAIFSVVSGILLRPLPYPHAEQVFSFSHEAPTWLSSEPDFIDYKRGMKTLSGLAAYTRGNATLTAAATPERVRAIRATEEFFPVLQVKPLLGRTFVSEEYGPRIAPSVVLSYGLWQRDFGGDRRVLGQRVQIEGVARTIVGVMPPNFAYPEARTDLWMPMQRFRVDSAGDRQNNYLFMVGRLKPGVSLERALVEAKGVAGRIMAAEPNRFDPKRPLTPHFSSVNDDVVGSTRPYLLSLLGAVGFVLLIACANVANLLLVRGEARRREMAVRSALGASPRRLATQLLTESVALSCIGGALGLLLAWSGDRALIALAPPSIPRLDEIGIDWRVLSFTAVVAMATGVLVGVMPAWRGSRSDPVSTLNEGGKTTAIDSGRGIARRGLVIAEVALAVMMLTGAGMLLRSLWHLEKAGVGFNPANVLTAKVSISPREYNDARAAVFFDQLVSRLRAVPGVREVGASGWLPVVDAGGLWGYRPEGGVFPDGRWPFAVPQQVTPGYFKAAGIPLYEGRSFTAQDRADGELVVVVSRKLAESAWPGASAIGKRIQLGGDDAPYLRIVGVVGDIRARGFGDVVEPTMYFAYAQSAKSAYFMPRSMALLLRVNGNPLGYTAQVNRVVHSLDANAPVSEVRTLEAVAGQSVAVRRFNTALLAGFAGLALLLAGIGAYGVISYGVSQRRFEIGVRRALGAADPSVMMLVMSDGLRLAGVGLVIGLAASIAAGRAIRAMLVDVPIVDAPSLAVTMAALIVVASLASLLPARRALRVNPAEALRGD